MGYIFGIMILGGFIREHSALEDVYSLAKKYVKDNRVLVIITSLLGGILPILDVLLSQHHSLMPSHHLIRRGVLPLV